MRFIQWLVLATLILTEAALAQGFGLRPGLWEVTMVRQTMDGRDITAQLTAGSKQMQQQAMARMTPEQRKQMEAMTSSQGAPESDSAGVIRRLCVSPAMAARDKPMIDLPGHCPPSQLNHSGNKTTFTFNCTKNGFGATGKGESVVAGDALSTRVDVTMTQPDGTHKMQGETQMKYLGKDCQGIKPMDELGFEDSDDEN